MGRSSEREKRCRRHPSHMQSMGVCPSCLREKLHQLSAPSSSATTYSSSSSTSACSSTYSSDDESDLSSSASSPPHKMMMSLRIKAKAGRPPAIEKSKSFGFVANKKQKEGEREENKGEKERKRKKKMKEEGGRFWSKLMVGSSRRKEEDAALFHSNTMKERPSSKWVLFA